MHLGMLPCLRAAGWLSSLQPLIGRLAGPQLGVEAARFDALSPAGGWLHVHCNVLDLDEGRCVEGAARELRTQLHSLAGRQDWSLRVHHVERVKWCGPDCLTGCMLTCIAACLASSRLCWTVAVTLG